MNLEFVKTILTLLFGGAFMGFLQFLIQRKDNKDAWKEEILESNKQLEAKVMKLDLKIDANKVATMQQIDALKDSMSERFKAMEDENQQQNTVQARIRLLRFADEIRLGQRHSKDSYNQTMQDVDIYEEYCEAHPKFKNNIAVSSIELIRKMFAERMEKDDFL